MQREPNSEEQSGAERERESTQNQAIIFYQRIARSMTLNFKKKNITEKKGK